MAITKEIVAKLSKTSRFLKYDDNEQVWKTISALAARDKVSHALRFANLKENRKLSTCSSKPVPRRVSASSRVSIGSSSKTHSPEDRKFWNSLVSRQTELLEKIKNGERGEIPDIVELPLPGDAPADEDMKYDPLSIDDSSFLQNPTFQDYCLQLYRSEDLATVMYVPVVEEITEGAVSKSVKHFGYWGYQVQDGWDTNGDPIKETCQYEDQSQYENSSCVISQSRASYANGDEIESILTEPLMAWDLEHDGIFEEV
jgi:hypothetical protein